MNIFKRFKDYLQLREAVRLADMAHEKDNDRYYVMPSEDGKLIVMDRKNFRKLKQKHYISHEAKVIDLMWESFYYTPNKGNDFMPDIEFHFKLKKYYKWREDFRKAKKLEKYKAKHTK